MATKAVPPTQVEVLGKKSIFFGPNLTTFLVNDLMKVSKAQTFVIITDTHLATLHLPELRSAFEKVANVEHIVDSMEDKRTNGMFGIERRTRSKKTVLTYVLPPGEGSKSREMAGKLQDFLLGQGLNADTCLIAFGGGVIGDLVGYVASTFLRGVELVQIPTTLLAMADSSVGGKNGVDTPEGKNLIGTTYQPIRIYTNPDYLTTLPQRELVNGMAEVIKTYALMGETEFATLEKKVDNLAGWLEERELKDTPQVLKIYSELTLASLQFKAEVVTDDVGDTGHRQALNFGHTVGHALESHFEGTILHGECVAVGMVLEQQIAITTKWGKGSDMERLKTVIAKSELPTSVMELELMALKLGKDAPTSTDQLLRKMRLDKKNCGKEIHMSLLAGFGKPARQNRRSVAVEDADIIGALRRQLAQKGRRMKADTKADSPYAMKSVPPTLQGRENSIIVIGAHGNVLGDKLAAALNWGFVPEPTVEAFEKSLQRHVLALPPAQTENFKKLLLGWMKKGGIVIHLLSSTLEDEEEFVDVEMLSNYTYYFEGDIGSGADLEVAADTLLHLVNYANGKCFNKLPSLGSPSYFLSLLVSDVTPHLRDLPSMVSGTWAAELRLDYLAFLHDEDGGNSIQTFKKYIAKQVSLVRGAVRGHPLIFTFRTEREGGLIATDQMSEHIFLDIFHYATRLGFEFIDLEIELSSKFWIEMGHGANLKSLIIASFHSLDKPLDWTGGEGESLLEKAVELGGDIIKLVSVADSLEDNQKVVMFVDEYYRHGFQGVPLIAFTLGALGEPTRVTNRFLTPVTHVIISKAGKALGQLSCTEIQRLRYHGVLPPRREFFIFGSAIGYSRSPLIHNTNFHYFHLPFQYDIKDTLDLEAIRETIRSPSFGGASVTIPHKETIIPLLDSISKVAEQIGAVNTIVVENDGRLRGENTDWLGILHCLKRKLRTSPRDLSKCCALLIGAGGTAKAALYALNCFGFQRIYLLNRTESKVEELAKCYPAETGRTEMKIYNGKKESFSRPDCPLVVIVNTTPGNSGMCPNSFVNEVLKEGQTPRVLVNLAYSGGNPGEVELKPWISFVSGIDVLLEQGIWAAQLWTGLKPDVEFLRNALENPGEPNNH